MTDTPDIRIVELMEEGITDMPTSPQPPVLTDEQREALIDSVAPGDLYRVRLIRDMASLLADAAFAAGCEAQRKMDEAESDELAAKCVELEQQVHDAYLLGKDEQRKVDAEIARQEREAAHLEHDRWDQGYRRACDNVARAIERIPEQPTTQRDKCGCVDTKDGVDSTMCRRHSQPTTGEAGDGL